MSSDRRPQRAGPPAVKIYLIRHADAVDEGPDLPDPHRHLSARGREEARRIGERLASRGVAFDAVLTSPLTRAVQTAELVTAALGFLGPVESLLALEPGASPRAAAAEVPARGEAVAVIGHEPGISALATVLLRAPCPAFRKAQVTLVEDGHLAWTITPDSK